VAFSDLQAALPGQCRTSPQEWGLELISKIGFGKGTAFSRAAKTRQQCGLQPLRVGFPNPKEEF
jgi:hypothetical protein